MPRHGPPTALIFTPILIVFVWALPIFGPLSPAAVPFDAACSNCARAGMTQATHKSAIAEKTDTAFFRTETSKRDASVQAKAWAMPAGHAADGHNFIIVPAIDAGS